MTQASFGNSGTTVSFRFFRTLLTRWILDKFLIKPPFFLE